MILDFDQRDTLPRLAWLAEVDGNRVRVAHGPWVEVRSEGFVEGVWDGEFPSLDFDKASDFFGSGGRLRDDHVVFASPTHHIDRLYVLETDSSVLVSNSWAFLLAETGDGPDLAYPNYFFDFVRHQREGVSMGTVALTTAKGRQVRLFACCNVRIDSDLSVRPQEKNPGPEPRDFSDYRQRLDQVIEGVFRNAADDDRRRRFRPVAAISTGYDSVAAAALAAQAGCREAITFATSASASGMVNDHGGPIAEALGMKIHVFGREGVHNTAVDRQAEWFLSPLAHGEAGLGLAEEVLSGSVLVTGRRGETAWGRARRSSVPGLRSTFDTNLSAVDAIEQRVRCGYVQFHPGFIAALHAPVLYRFNCSSEMDPWSIDQRYDRPTARRIAEEAGVPRELFGQTKAGGAGPYGGLAPEALDDFLKFYQERVPKSVRRRLRNETTRRRFRMHIYLIRLRTRFAARRFHEWLFETIGLDRMHMLRNSRDLYKVHWGLLKTMDRYRP